MTWNGEHVMNIKSNWEVFWRSSKGLCMIKWPNISTFKPMIVLNININKDLECEILWRKSIGITNISTLEMVIKDGWQLNEETYAVVVHQQKLPYESIISWRRDIICIHTIKLWKSKHSDTVNIFLNLNKCRIMNHQSSLLCRNINVCW